MRGFRRFGLRGWFFGGILGEGRCRNSGGIGGRVGHSAVTFEELLADFDLTAEKWKGFFATNSAAEKVPTDIAGTGTIGGLVCHIYMAAVRHSERLLDVPVSEFKTSRDLATAWELEKAAKANLQRFLASANDASLDGTLTFTTKAAGEVTVTRRKLCVRIFLFMRFGTGRRLVRWCGRRGFPWGGRRIFCSAAR